MQGVLARPRHNLLNPLCNKSNEYCQLTSNPSGAIIRSGQMAGDSKSHCIPTTKNQEGVRSSIQAIIQHQIHLTYKFTSQLKQEAIKKLGVRSYGWVTNVTYIYRANASTIEAPKPGTAFRLAIVWRLWYNYPSTLGTQVLLVQ
jgi:hypothetical protein